MNDKTKSILKNSVKFVLFATALYFAGRQLSKNWSEALAYDWELNYPYLLISMILQIVTLAMFSKSWCTVLEAIGFKIKFWQGFKISYLANLGRYLPGKFWQLFGMIYLLKEVNVGKKAAFSSWALSWIYGLPPAFLLCGIAALSYDKLLSDLVGGIFNNVYYIIAFIAIIFGSSVLFIFIPDYSIKFLNFILKLLKREKIAFKFEKIKAFKIYAFYFIAWIIYGLAFFFLLKGLDSSSNVPFMVGLGSFVLAYVVGLLALFSPGGLGVRELILISLLTPYFGAISSGIVLAARIWSLVAEFFTAGIALIIHLRERDSKNEG